MANIKATQRNNYTVDISSENHNWVADEPISRGGGDLGPTPTELMLSSLASCKIITVKMYAARKGWDIKGIDIKLEIIGNEDKTVIEKKIVIQGDLDDKQRKRLLDISDRCPIVKMLSDSLDIRTV